VLLLGLFLLLKAFAVSETLHHSLHSDAATPNHHCVITLLAHGQVAAPGLLAVLAVIVAGFVFFLPETKPLQAIRRDFALAPTRGHPCV